MVTIGLGVPMPILTPVTATWTAPFALYLSFLNNRIVYHRLRNSTYLGDRTKSSVALNEQPEDDQLFVATRCQANFLENVPLALVVAAVAELNGANRRTLHYALATLFALRVAHAELGLTKSFRGIKSIGLGRITAFYGSQAFVLGVAGWAAWLCKGYWGF